MNTQTRPKSRIRQNPREPQFVQNPYALYQRLHELGDPVFWEDYGFYCISSFESVNRILRDRRFARLPPRDHPQPAYAVHLSDFAQAEKYSLLAMEPPEHTRLRKTVNHAFMSRHISGMAPVITSLANNRIDFFEAAGRAELLSCYASPLPVAVITRLLGVPESAGQQLLDWSHRMVRVYTMTQSYEEEVAANTAAREFTHFIRDIIACKRCQADDDLISNLLATQHSTEPLSDEEIISVVILLLNAGHEATVHQLGNAVHILLAHYPLNKRHLLLELLCDEEKADALVAECLRYDAPLHLFMRYAQQDIELDGSVQIAAGTQIGLLLAAANRCPVRFTQADVFQPNRSDGANLSLGAGLHFCVGAHLARLELRIALQVLFRRLPGLVPAGSAEYQDSYHFHGLKSLPVSW